jgi:hypothetical protein
MPVVSVPKLEQSLSQRDRYVRSMDDQGSTDDIEDETLRRIRERTLQAESEQLHMRRPHKIIPEIREIVEEEIPE